MSSQLTTAMSAGIRHPAWPEYSFVGDTYVGFLEPGLHVGFRVADASAWVFAGTGLRDGEVIPGVVASDVDKFDRTYGQPPDDQIFGHSPIPPGLGQTSIGAFFSDMTYYTDAATGAHSALIHDRGQKWALFAQKWPRS